MRFNYSLAGVLSVFMKLTIFLCGILFCTILKLSAWASPCQCRSVSWVENFIRGSTLACRIPRARRNMLCGCGMIASHQKISAGQAPANSGSRRDVNAMQGWWRKRNATAASTRMMVRSRSLGMRKLCSRVVCPARWRLLQGDEFADRLFIGKDDYR
jgi:hypothetical protein